MQKKIDINKKTNFKIYDCPSTLTLFIYFYKIDSLTRIAMKIKK